MLINDADWELLVSASGDIPPPTPALTALVAKPWPFIMPKEGDWVILHPTLAPRLRLFKSPTASEEGKDGWGRWCALLHPGRLQTTV